MKLIKTNKLSVFALTGFIATLASVASHAALVAPLTPESSGIALGASVVNFPGTVVANQTLSFSDTLSTPTPAYTGTLRSTVVRNTTNGNLDFYYQLANTTTNTASVDPEIFRLTITNFHPSAATSGGSFEIFNVSNGLTGITGAGSFVNGTNDADTADRDPGIPAPSIGGVGFDWGTFLDQPASNLQPGQTSNFLVVRTNQKDFRTSQAQVFGAGAATVGTFVPVPEPTTALMGLALASFAGCTEFGRGRRRKAQAAQS